jgi:hypothetical protein
MRRKVRDIFARLRALPHPPQAGLIASIDGELAPPQEARMRAHLQVCQVCRARLDLLLEGVGLFDRTLASTRSDFSVEAELQHLMSTIHRRGQWIGEGSLAGMGTESSGLYGRLLSELSIYLGRRAALELLQRCRQAAVQRDRLQETIAPVVIGFLGQHTGSAVLANVGRIWDQSQEVTN